LVGLKIKPASQTDLHLAWRQRPLVNGRIPIVQWAYRLIFDSFATGKAAGECLKTGAIGCCRAQNSKKQGHINGFTGLVVGW